MFWGKAAEFSFPVKSQTPQNKTRSQGTHPLTFTWPITISHRKTHSAQDGCSWLACALIPWPQDFAHELSSAGNILFLSASPISTWGNSAGLSKSSLRPPPREATSSLPQLWHLLCHTHHPLPHTAHTLPPRGCLACLQTLGPRLVHAGTCTAAVLIHGTPFGPNQVGSAPGHSVSFPPGGWNISKFQKKDNSMLLESLLQYSLHQFHSTSPKILRF